MAILINQDDIIQQVTNDILKEISESNVTFTNEEIKNKINQKIDIIFDNYKIEQFNTNTDEAGKEDNLIQSEFVRLDNDEQDEEYSLGDFDDEAEDNFDDLQDTEEDSVLPEEKKKFFQEFPSLYKSELEKSLRSFKNAFDSLKLLKESSMIEKVLIISFLSIPAILGGVITLVLILLIILLWQISILFRVLLKFFTKFETALKSSINNLKKKIEIAKKSGGFFNKMLFSNALYSVIFFNGLMYLLVKGMMLPLKSVSEIDKIVANLLARSINIVTTGLRGPSEMALNNMGINGLKAGKGPKGKQAPKSKLQLKEKSKLKLKSKELSKAKRDLSKEQAKTNSTLNVAKALADKEAIKKGIEASIKANNATKNAELESKIASAVEKANSVNAPTSSELSPEGRRLGSRDDISSLILNNVLDTVKRSVGNLIDNNLDLNKIASINNNKDLSDKAESDRQKAQIIKNDIDAGNRGDNIANSNFEGSLKTVPNDADIARANEAYEKGGVMAALGELPGFNEASPEQKLEAALAYGQKRDAMDDVKDNAKLRDFVREHPDATPREVAAYDEKLARQDLRNEIEQFEARYGVKPNELIAEKMQERGIDPKADLSNEQLKEITKEIVMERPGLTESEKYGMMKDFGEYSAAFTEKERTKEQTKNMQRTETREHSHVNDINRGGGGIGPRYF